MRFPNLIATDSLALSKTPLWERGRIKGALRRDLGSAVTNIHVEPERKAKHTGIVVL